MYCAQYKRLVVLSLMTFDSIVLCQYTVSPSRNR